VIGLNPEVARTRALQHRVAVLAAEEAERPLAFALDLRQEWLDHDRHPPDELAESLPSSSRPRSARQVSKADAETTGSPHLAPPGVVQHRVEVGARATR
jgi:hypothetical protein